MYGMWKPDRQTKRIYAILAGGRFASVEVGEQKVEERIEQNVSTDDTQNYGFANMNQQHITHRL